MSDPIAFTVSSAAGTASVSAAAGTRLLDAILGAGIDIPHSCGGNLACGTCHVKFDEKTFASLAPPSEEELDTLDLADDPSETSRLACACKVAPEMAGATVAIP